MTEEKWEVVDEVQGDMQAEILKGMLEAQGIKSVALAGRSRAFRLRSHRRCHGCRADPGSAASDPVCPRTAR